MLIIGCWSRIMSCLSYMLCIYLHYSSQDIWSLSVTFHRYSQSAVSLHLLALSLRPAVGESRFIWLFVPWLMSLPVFWCAHSGVEAAGQRQPASVHELPVQALWPPTEKVRRETLSLWEHMLHHRVTFTFQCLLEFFTSYNNMGHDKTSFILKCYIIILG